MMRSARMHAASFATLALAVILGCASTQVETESEYGRGRLPRPDRVLVYDFAVTPGEVRLDRGLSAELAQAAKGDPRSVEELETGRKVADVLAEHLVRHIRDLGLPAQRASGAHPTQGTNLLIEGQILSIDEGNRTARVVIGLGAGRSDVETAIQVIDASPQGEQVVESFRTKAKSGRKPGMTETMGVGAAAGNLAASAVASTVLAGASETFGANVEADARRTAKEVAKKLGDFFVEQGWTTSEVVENRLPLE